MSQKLILTNIAVAIALSTVATTSAHARFLQTDPIGYEDQYNLYAYVGNDPINGVDPTGECEADADGNQVGVCPTTTQAANILSAQMSNPNSIAPSVESAAVQAGVKIDFSVDPNASNSSYEGAAPEFGVDGEVTIGLQSHSAVGTLVDGGPEGVIPFPTDEVVEHDLSHALDDVNGTSRYGSGTIEVSNTAVDVMIPGQQMEGGDPSPARNIGKGEARAVNKTNVYRRSMGRTRQRTRY